MGARRTNLTPANRPERGFSLLEALVVVSIVLLAATLFVPNMFTSIKNSQVSNGYDTTLMTIRQAREAAVSERRVYVVTFNSPNAVSVAPLTADSTALNLSRTLPQDVQFIAITGIPNTASTTPDGLGTGPSTGAIDFDIGVGSSGTNTVYFWPDGSSRDKDGNMNSGVLYIARPAELMSSRAITVWGASGRVRGWRLVQSSSGVKSGRQQ